MKSGLKKKIKNMNNEMAINTYLSAIESKKHTKQTRTETESRIQSILMAARWEGGVGE